MISKTSLLNSPFADTNSREVKLTPYLFGVNHKPLTEVCGWYFDGQIFYRRRNG